MKKGLFLLSTLILLSISFLSCQKDCSIESKDTGLTVTPENIGLFIMNVLKLLMRL